MIVKIDFDLLAIMILKRHPINDNVIIDDLSIADVIQSLISLQKNVKI